MLELTSFRKRRLHIGRPRRPAVAGIVMALSFALLLAALTLPTWLPSAIRRAIPDRYIDAYAPAPLRAFVFQRNTSTDVLPTAASVAGTSNQALAQGLLGETRSDVAGSENSNNAPVSTQPAAQNISIPNSYTLQGFNHTYQAWNNCGPATLTTTLSYWGVDITQNNVAGFVKPNPEDRNVRPDELAAYTVSIGKNAVVRVNGNLQLLKQLIAAGFPPIVEQGFEVEKLGWMGHYTVLTGYSDDKESFTSQDSYLGPNRQYAYAEIEKYWPHFNRTYIIVYDSKQANEVEAIVSADMDDQAMWKHSLDSARAQLGVNANDPFGWFNLGSSLLALGNNTDAAVAFDQARALGLPWRMLWYQFGPFEAYLAVDRYADVRNLADSTLADNIYSEEAYYYKGRAYLGEGKTLEARAQFETAVQYNKNYQAALNAIASMSK